ncbi:response regulator [Pedobacter sp. KLB.chiD]|uniref:response regulator n=1 Tax=Pedobacter sp. KLB.chiD TaxID=3387402 RepID=UPI00399A1B4D
MKRIKINHKFNQHNQTKVLLTSLLPIMMNDNYLHLDSSGKIMEYSQNTINFFRTILNTTIEVDTSLFAKLINDKKAVSALHYFLDHNINDEIVDIHIALNNISIQLRLIKIFYQQQHIGYNCILEHKREIDASPIQTRIRRLQDFSKLMNKTLSIGLNAINDASFCFSGNNKNIYKKLSAEFHLLARQSAVMLKSIEETFHISELATPKINIAPKFINQHIKNIMVIESERLSHMVTRSLLKSISKNFNVFSFMSVDEASEFIRTHPTDLIFLEFEISESMGNKFLETIDKLMLDTPIILSSTFTDPSTIDSIIKYRQIKGILDKPITRENLLHIFNS